MTVASVGTPAALGSGTAVNRTTSSPVTGEWGTGQNRTADNLLVAVVTAGAATSVTATAENTGTSGWTKQFEVFNTTGAGTTQVLVAVWTKIAAGSDAAPAFTSTLSGTAAMSCTLYELSGADTFTLFDTSGTESSSGSGTGTVTISSTAAITGADVTYNGEFAIMAACRERSANTYTITGSGGSWTLDANDGSTNSVSHTGVQSYTNPPSGSTLTGTISYSGTATLAYGAGVIVVFYQASNSKVSALSDPFNQTSLNATLWSASNSSDGTSISYATSGVTMALPASSTSATYANLTSQVDWDFTYSSAVLHVTGVTSAATNAYNYLSVESDSNNYVQWSESGGTLTAYYYVAGVQTSAGSVTYSPGTHAWWRIRESGGTVYWDTSPDRQNWTNRASIANPFGLSNVNIQIGAGCYENETNPGSFSFNDFNFIPSVAYPLQGPVRSRINKVYVLGNPGLIYVKSRDGTP